MKKVVIAAALALGIAAHAFAADLPMKAAPPPLAPVFSWTGFYIGGNIGGAWSNNRWTDSAFLTNFNNSQFNIQVRARDYYSFVSLTLLSMGILFQIPMVIVVLTRLGILTPRQLRAHRRYAYLGCAILAALLPTVDPVSMLLEMIPLLLLYELSILLASLLGRPKSDTAPAAVTPEGSG